MFDQYIGIPYSLNGRDYTGVDCYGLVWLVEKELFNKVLPKLDTFSNEESNAELFADHRPLIQGQLIDKPVNGDVVVMFIHDVPQHVGVYMQNGVLHATEKNGVVWELLTSSYMRRFNKKEFYRV